MTIIKCFFDFCKIMDFTPENHKEIKALHAIYEDYFLLDNRQRNSEYIFRAKHEKKIVLRIVCREHNDIVITGLDGYGRTLNFDKGKHFHDAMIFLKKWIHGVAEKYNGSPLTKFPATVCLNGDEILRVDEFYKKHAQYLERVKYGYNTLIYRFTKYPEFTFQMKPTGGKDQFSLIFRAINDVKGSQGPREVSIIKNFSDSVRRLNNWFKPIKVAIDKEELPITSMEGPDEGPVHIETIDKNTSIALPDIKTVVWKTKEHLESKFKHYDIRPYWNELGCDNQMQIQLINNLTADDIIHLLDSDNWQVILTAHVGRQLTLDQLDNNGRILKKHEIRKGVSAAFNHPVTNWIMGVQLLVIIALSTLWYTADQSNQFRYDTGWQNGYEQGKDTYSNEKIKWLDENQSLKNQNVDLTQERDSLLHLLGDRNR